MDLFTNLSFSFPKSEIFQHHSLAPYTTVKIGGPADVFFPTQNTDQFVSILKFIHQQNIKPITILGNGSNVLISDSGIPGLVLKNSGNDIHITPNSKSNPISPSSTQISSRRQENDPTRYLNFATLDYDESHQPTITVRLSSGTSLPYAINYLIDHQVTGLQWFAYIPGTIGGAVWYNIHGGSHHFSDYLDSIEVFNLTTGQIETLCASALDWGYDQSFFQSNPHLVILSATLQLFQGDTAKAKQVVKDWTLQKAKVQPMNSTGSVFKNPSLSQCQPLWGEQKSTGWIIDQGLGWKGKTLGQVQISPTHANIFVNNGNASARDYLSLIRQVQSAVKDKFGLDLELEVKLLGEFPI